MRSVTALVFMIMVAWGALMAPTELVEVETVVAQSRTGGTPCNSDTDCDEGEACSNDRCRPIAVRMERSL